MAEATATTRPARKRAPAAKKAAPAKTAGKAPAAAAEPEEEGTQRFTFECEPLPDTKNYAVFVPPKSSGCVGKIYVPLGTQRVRIGFIGPKDN